MTKVYKEAVRPVDLLDADKAATLVSLGVTRPTAHKAFAELNGTSAPFADALARQKVVAFGTPYLSRKWHNERRPYNWSIATDCSIVAETAGEYYVNLLAGRNADYAGPGLQGKPRVLVFEDSHSLLPASEYLRRASSS